MLGLVAAQLKYKVENKDLQTGKAVWVDVRYSYELARFYLTNDFSRLAVVQGEDLLPITDQPILMRSRYNIEAMAAFVSVPEFFSHVYLVDLSPSLCEVARQRFERLGWKNVSVVCQDARSFRLPEDDIEPGKTSSAGADVVTMSYSLSMIPGMYSCDIAPNEDSHLQITTV
jgi:betaine lipid synthase